MNDDLTLLREYARNQSETAFSALVSRHVDLVYSVALRQVGAAHLAEEVTQTVFIILARKAGTLGEKTILPGWLCRTARYASFEALRQQRRRQHHEQEVAMQPPADATESAETWQHIAPHLDEAMHGLAQKDHDALVLRFFQNKNFAEVGAALGASEDAAKMRVGRALEKLRKLFSKRGLVLTVGAITTAVSAHSVSAAPAGLSKMVVAIAGTKGLAASASTKAIMTGASKMMAWAKAQTIIVFSSVAILGMAGGAVVTHKLTTSRSYLRITGTGQIVLFNIPPQTVQTAQFTILTDGKSYRISMDSSGEGKLKNDFYDCHADYASDGNDLFILSDQPSYFNRKPGGLAGFAYSGRELGNAGAVPLTAHAIWLAYCSRDYFAGGNHETGLVLGDEFSLIWPDYVTNSVHSRPDAYGSESITGWSRNVISLSRTNSLQPIKMTRLKQYPNGFLAWKFTASNFTNIASLTVPLTLEMEKFFPKMSETNLAADDTFRLSKATFQVDSIRIEKGTFDPLPPVMTNQLKIEDWRFKDISGNFIVESHATPSGWPVRGSKEFAQSEAQARKLAQNGPPPVDSRPTIIEAP